MKELLIEMIEARQLSEDDGRLLTSLVEDGDQQTPESEEHVLQWLASEYELEYNDLEELEPDKELLASFPARVLTRQELLPIARENGTVRIATSKLFHTEGIDTLKSLTGLHLQPVLSPAENLRKQIKQQLGVGAETINQLEEEAGFEVLADEDADEGDLDSAAEDASIIRFVNQVLKDAIEINTSDIHLEPFEDEFRIRYRVDGVLQDIPVPATIKRFQPAIVSRIKILSQLNIAEKRLPQDGRIKLRTGDYDVDVRVSVIPMLHGEAVVMRLLRQDSSLRPMTELGMNAREVEIFNKVLGLPHGIALVTGPTGSGKTSTLYTALNQINDSVRKIITIEDPVEYQLKGVNQIQVSEKAGLSFARGLRSILRHDPDVVLVGEIRDKETAQIAVQASLTGHLVFSTLHTNDAPSALTRLVDMGVEPYLVASSLEAVLAQRLVRVLCNECKVEDTAAETEALKRRIPQLEGATIYKDAGCEACRNMGYAGRHAIFELMDLSPDIREMILEEVSSGQLKEAAIKKGMRTLNDDGWRLVAQGVTTPYEVMRVTKDQTGD